MENSKPMSEMERQRTAMPGEADLKDAHTKASQIASQVMPKRVKEYKKQEIDDLRHTKDGLANDVKLTGIIKK